MQAIPSQAIPWLRQEWSLCFPIRAQGQLVAFVALGRQLHGEAYGTDDCDLLKGISHHVGVLLSHARLAEERQASAELEALHRFSVFCLHDLKNLASRLSLVAQNAESHGRDPAFQESAIRTVSDTAKKMTALMSKLSLKSFKPSLAGAPVPVDLSTLIDEVIAPIRAEHVVQTAGHRRARPSGDGGQGPDSPSLAQRGIECQTGDRQAGTISIGLAETNGSVVVTIEDTGSGIPPAHARRHCFARRNPADLVGLGVGLYQCKQIVEAHRGTIQIRSEAGNGTQVKIELPVIPAPPNRENDAIVQTKCHPHTRVVGN